MVFSPCEDLWIIDTVEIEFKIPKMYPADPPELRLSKEPSARSLVAKSGQSSVSVDGQTGAISSKLLNVNNWSRTFGLCPVYHDIRRFFEIPTVELLDGAIYQRWQLSQTPQSESRALWRTKMFSHELQGKRASMEDQVSLVDNIYPGRETKKLERRDSMGKDAAIEAPIRFAAVFDGHGGPGAALHFSKALPTLIGEEVGRGVRPPKAMYASMSKCDRRFLDTKNAQGEYDPSGSTCTCVLIDAVGRCLIGNVGDYPCGNFSITRKDLRKALEQKFDCSLRAKKDFLRAKIDEILNNEAASTEEVATGVSKAIPVTLEKCASLLDGRMLLEYLPKERIKALLKSDKLALAWENPTYVQQYAAQSHANEVGQLKAYLAKYNDKCGAAFCKYVKPKHKWGRVHPEKSLGLTSLGLKVRNTLIRDLYYDLDLKNAQVEYFFIFMLSKSTAINCGFLK